MKSFSKIFLGMALAACLGFAGCGGDEAGTDTTTPPAAGEGAGDDGSGDKDGAMNTTGDEAEMVAVSLKLPNMT